MVSPEKKRKIALVCDWLTEVGGAEKVLLALHEMYPEAPIYTSQYDPKRINWFLDADVRVGNLQRFPSKLRRFLAPLRAKYFQGLDLSEYDLVISVTGAEAKGVKTVGKVGAGRHICYCHVPTQYYWQLYDEYIKEPGFGVLNPFMRVGLRTLVGKLRKWDFQAAQKPDQFITISTYAREQIKKYYKREAIVIAPPVEVREFQDREGKENIEKNTQGKKFSTEFSTGETCKGSILKQDFNKCQDSYIVTARQVTWKRLDLAVKACLELKRPLLVIGRGPEHEKLEALAGGVDFIKFLPVMDLAELKGFLREARGYLFPSLEPFGIAPVEALAVGCPVIAYNQGGSRDFIIEKKNGVFFEKQTVESLKEAILKFEKINFQREVVSKTAEQFSKEEFKRKIREVVDGQ